MEQQYFFRELIVSPILKVTCFVKEINPGGNKTSAKYDLRSRPKQDTQSPL